MPDPPQQPTAVLAELGWADCGCSWTWLPTGDARICPCRAHAAHPDFTAWTEEMTSQ